MRICTNDYFNSVFFYTMLNIPRELFTPLFAISRIAGWSAHRIEEIVAGGRIYRPAYKNVSEERAYVPIEDRVEHEPICPVKKDDSGVVTGGPSD